MGKDYGYKEIYSSNHDYAYEPEDTPTHYESDPHRGIVDHASAMLEAVPGKTKGGAIHYTFGFVDEEGKVCFCPCLISVEFTVGPHTLSSMQAPKHSMGHLALSSSITLWSAAPH